MSNSRDIMYRGITEFFIPFHEDKNIFFIDAGRIVTEVQSTDPKVNLAPNYQDYTLSHRKNRRGKFKRSGK